MTSRVLADAAIRYPEIRQELYAQHGALESESAKAILEGGMAEAADTAGVLMLVRSNGAEGRRLRQTFIYSALQHILTTPRASPHFAGAQEVVSIAAPELRRELFSLALQGGHVANLAIEALEATDDIRDGFGVATSERRHPDITKKRPGR